MPSHGTYAAVQPVLRALLHQRGPGGRRRRAVDQRRCWVMADIACVNPGTFLILTGRLLLRRTSSTSPPSARDHGFTVVLGTNGVLLRETQARRMSCGRPGRRSPSTHRPRPATFGAPARRLAGCRPRHRGPPRRGTRLLAPRHGLERREIPGVIRSRAGAGARVLNFFVRTGRGAGLTDIRGSVRSHSDLPGACAGSGETACIVFERREDPWERPGGPDRRAPHPAKVRPTSGGSCGSGIPALASARQLRPRVPARPASTHCRITPTGDVTPCPYMPVAAGEPPGTQLWGRAPSLPTSGVEARRSLRRLRVPDRRWISPPPRLRDLW